MTCEGILGERGASEHKLGERWVHPTTDSASSSQLDTRWSLMGKRDEQRTVGFQKTQ
jgi:hypothetical protein